MIFSIEEQAARWVARADGGMSVAERMELDAWLQQDPRHSGAYARALGYWVRLDRVAALNGPTAVEPNIAKDTFKFGRRELMAAAVAAAMIGGSSWWLWPRSRMGAASLGQSYSSGVGELKRVALADGSVLLLNTSSVVWVDLGKHQRTVRLLSGEVLFEVAPDKVRPFVVGVRDAAVRAVGTAFVVRLDSERVDVTVTEGVVEVGRVPVDLGARPIDSLSKSALTRVSEMQQAILVGGDEVQIHSIDAADAERELAWREGMVSFTGQSLSAAVAEINRYNRRKIIVSDLVLAAKPVVGVFGVTDLDGFVAAAAAALKAKAVEDDDVIRLERDLSVRN